VTVVERVAGGVLAVCTIAVVVAGSNAPMTAHRSPDAVLRLAWSARPERVETCRQQTEEELARLPQHMRQPVVCEGTTAEYRLLVRLGGVVVVDRVVRGGGLRQDRRLYVFEELAVPAGSTKVEVRFERLGGDDPGADGGAVRTEPEDEAARRHQAEAVPPRLALERPLRLAPRVAVLITYDPERRMLVAVEGPGR
jgi:hypothetical protein